MKALLSLIIVMTRSQRRWMLAGILLGVAVLVANTLLMALSGWFITSMAIAGAAGASFNYFFSSGAIRGLAISRTVGRYGERLITHEAAFRMLEMLRIHLFTQLAPRIPTLFGTYNSADLAGRLRADIDALEQLYLRILFPLGNGLFSLILALIFVSCYSPQSALVLALFLILGGMVLPLISRSLSRLPGRRSAELAGELRSTVSEGFSGAEELLLLDAVTRQGAQVASLSSRLVTVQQQLAGYAGINQAGTLVAAGFSSAALLAVGVELFSQGNLSGPVLVMLLLFSGAVFEAVALIPPALHTLPATSASARRIMELIASPIPQPDPFHPAQLPTTFALSLSQVSCAYIPSQPVLTNFCLEVPQGTCVALWGPSGSGKSTVAELLLRFRDYDGSIRIGGIELRDLVGDDLRGIIGALPQQPHLFNSDIRSNLLVGNPEADEETLNEVLRDMALYDWVMTLPEGLDTPVGEGGSRISGGEAKRIALARALLKNAPVLLLDEPTEGLDPATEQQVVAGLSQRIRGKTVVLITHRPATLSLAGQVVRMD